MLAHLVDHPIQLPSGLKTLSLPFKPSKAHPLSPKLQLLAVILSGNPLHSSVFQEKLKKSSSQPENLKLPQNTNLSLTDGNFFAYEGVRKGGSVAYYIKHDICFSTRNILSKKIKVIFVDLLLPKTKPISVHIFYRPPKDISFLQLFAEILNSLNILENEIFALGDMNINILQNGENLLGKNVYTSKGN